MAVFPKELDYALKAAIDMQHSVQGFSKTEGQSIIVGMGLHVGPLVMGIIGDELRNEPTTIADTVNAASRMESLTKHYGANIIVTEHCFTSLKNPDQFHFRYLGKVQVKGKERAIGAYECFDGDTQAIRKMKIENGKLFEQGMDQFYSKEFSEATAIFGRILKMNPDDQVALYFRDRAGRYMLEGVTEDWDGIEKLDAK